MYYVYFREEAQRVWEKREVEWEKERKARERLMYEVNCLQWLIPVYQLKKTIMDQKCSFVFLGKVLVGRKTQLELKMQKNREAQEESLKRREELIQELELERELRRREKEQEEGHNTARMQEIQAQVGAIYFFCRAFSFLSFVIL